MDLANVRQRFTEVWARLDRKQKAIGAGLVALFVLAAVLSLTASRKPSYAVAYSGLTQEDAASIVAKLQEQKIPYEVSADESMIRVPANVVHDVRLQMASAGLPSGGTVGYEIFDTTNLGMTDFTQQLNYRRALEGELARTIASLDAVEQARVHIVQPETSLYTDQQKQTTASVLLKLKAGRHLTADQVQGITHLVATSVEGLQPESITVLDTSGTVLSDGLASQGAQLSDERLKAQQAYEDALQAKVQQMLETVLGPNRAVVGVHVDMDWTQTDVQKETYDPAVQGTPVVRSAREVRESSGSSPAVAQGAPGVDSNVGVPSYPGTAATPGATASASSGYEKSDLTYNYELSKTTSRQVEAPGKVKKISVSVLLDQVKDDQQMQRIRQAVTAAAGIDTQRGDVVTVDTVAFDRTYLQQEEAAMSKAAKQETYMSAARWGAIAIAVLVTLLIVRSVVMRSLARPRAASQTLGSPVVLAAGAGEDVAGVPQALQLPNGQQLELSPEQQALAASVQRQHQLMSLAEKQPEVLAQVIDLWLSDTNRRK